MSEVTDWIQASCAFLGVIGLAYYAWETHNIQVTALKQEKASRRPFFVFTFERFLNGDLELQAENIGAGHAINLRASTGEGVRLLEHTENSIVQAGAKRTLLRKPEFDIKYKFEGVRLEFEDLEKTRYWCEFRERDGKAQPSSPGKYVLSHGEEELRTLLQRLREWGS
jgi:hypothetical protein